MTLLEDPENFEFFEKKFSFPPVFRCVNFLPELKFEAVLLHDYVCIHLSNCQSISPEKPFPEMVSWWRRGEVNSQRERE